MPAQDGDPPQSPYKLPHLDVTGFKAGRDYQSTGSGNQGFGPIRNRQAHANRLLGELHQAQEALADSIFQNSEVFGGDRGAALEVQTPSSGRLPDMERRSQDIRVGAVKRTGGGGEQALLVLPEDKLLFLEQRITSYRDENTPKGNPRYKNEIESLEHIQLGGLEAFWTDVRPLPDEGEAIWWECWCWPDRVDALLRACERNHLHVAQQRLFFPNLTVLMILCDRAAIEEVVGSSFAAAELRRATDTPHTFVKTATEANLWIEELAVRAEFPQDDDVAVCLLDTGLNRAHPLLEAVTADEDCHAVEPAWAVTDHEGHGTGMAGLSLYGNLAPLLASTSNFAVGHRLESVKIIPPGPFPANDPSNYASITRSAVALPEIEAPARRRVFCMAVTSQDVSGERPTSWSAAIDQLASRSGLEDESDDGGAAREGRLFVVAAGNVPDDASFEDMLDTDEFPIEDPAQAWNALTVGGTTDLTHIAEQDLQGWSPMAQAGERSPYSRCSTDWQRGRAPIKPELVLESGNRAVSPDQGEVSSGVDSLSVLTTRNDSSGRLIDTFWATSAAAAQAARMAGAITASNEDIWPETVRALLIQSARWTAPMLQQLTNRNKSERHLLLRQFGYGVPDLDRALHSASSDVALISQATIRPFCRKPNHGASFKECHVYRLPWPRATLEQLGDQQVELKVTLSYFVEPAPGELAPIRPDRYRSAGLRFDLKRTGEPFATFLARRNKLEQEQQADVGGYADPRWLLDHHASSVGSLHSNTWIGPAVELLDRDAIVVYPVMGWWRERPALGKINHDLRYAFVLGLRSTDAQVDLYSEIEAAIELAAAAEIEI